MKRNLFVFCAAAGAAAVFGGCGPARATRDDGALREAAEAGPGAAADRAKASPAPDESAVRVRLAGKQDLAALVARHRGDVVLVDCWATWCEPCRRQFPHTVALYRKHAAQGLVVVSLSVDKPADEAVVLTFLREQHATFDNLLSREGASQQSFLDFGITNGELPYYMLFDRQGRLRNELGSASADPDHPWRPANLDRAVEKLLAEPGK